MPRTKKIDNSSGPLAFSRDENGLLKNIQYIFNEDGSVNWRAMIKDEHLFPNKSWFEARKKDCPRSAEGLADHQLLIKLSGIKELAKLRGFSDCYYDTVKCEQDHVAVKCSVTFIPNYETGGNTTVFSDMANATLNNTSSFATKFLETIACNRAFVRCVRNFLNVHIVGDDEIDKSETSKNIQSANPLSPSSILSKTAKEKLKCHSYDEFKSFLREWWQQEKYRHDDIKNWTDWSDIPASEIRKILSLL